MPREKQIVVWSRKEKERWKLWLTKRSKHQVEWKEQISLWSLSVTLPRQSNLTNRKQVWESQPPCVDCPKDISKSAWKVTVMVKNLTATLITIAKGIKVTQVVSANVVPPVEVVPGTLEKLDEIQGIQQTRLSVEWRNEMLFDQLELSGLKRWSDKNQAATRILLAKYHDILSLESGELGCTDLVKHEIGVFDKPFKERFWRIPPTYGGWGPCTHEGNVGSGH